MKYLIILFTIVFNLQSLAQASKAEELVIKGVELHDKGDYTNAIKCYQQALIYQPDYPTAWFELSISYMSAKDYQKSIEYANKLIANGSVYRDQAYVNKGSAYDLMGKFDESIATYKEGIKAFPKTYLLYYNLGYTYFKAQKINEAFEPIRNAVMLQPSHSSSNMLLAYTMYMKETKSQAMLPLYYYLLLEPDAQRSVKAFVVLNNLMGQGVERKDNNTININVQEASANSVFGSADLMLAVSQAAQFATDTIKLSEQDKFIQATHTFFSYLGQLKDPFPEPWDKYVKFFATLDKAGHTKAFCYYIAMSSTSFNSKDWMAKHEKEMSTFAEWAKANMLHNISDRNDTVPIGK